MKIFISIASYQDPMLELTILNAYEKAKRPENLVFGVCDQSLDLSATRKLDFHPAPDSTPVVISLSGWYLDLRSCVFTGSTTNAHSTDPTTTKTEATRGESLGKAHGKAWGKQGKAPLVSGKALFWTHQNYWKTQGTVPLISCPSAPFIILVA